MVGYLILPDGHQVEARDGLVLGRVASSDVVVRDTKASRRHAILRVEGSVVEIEDLESSNGTLLNGKKVQRRTLRHGDQIKIGEWSIDYREGAAPAPGAAPRSAAAAAPAASPGADELTFDDEAEPKSEPVRHPPPPRAAPPPVPASPSAAPSAPGSSDTLEFLDEVVKVRTSTQPERRPSTAKPQAQGGRDRGVLQFHKQADRRGVIVEDMEQMSGLKRFLLWAVALAVALAMGYLAMQMAR